MNKLLGTSLMLFLITATYATVTNSNPVDAQAANHAVPLADAKNTESSRDANDMIDQKILYSITQEDYVWKNGPASYPRGTQYTLLEGDPFGSGPYTIRVKYPPYYKLPAHAHDDIEELTVISGVFHIAAGDSSDEEEGFELPAGGFTVLYPNVNHFVWTGKEGAIVQIQGTGPRTSLYVDMKNDPTWKKQLQPDVHVASGSDQNSPSESAAAVPLEKTGRTVSQKMGVPLMRRGAISLSKLATAPLLHPRLAVLLRSTIATLSYQAGMVCAAQPSVQLFPRVASVFSREKKLTASLRQTVDHLSHERGTRLAQASVKCLPKLAEIPPLGGKLTASLKQTVDNLPRGRGITLAGSPAKRLPKPTEIPPLRGKLRTSLKQTVDALPREKGMTAAQLSAKQLPKRFANLPSLKLKLAAPLKQAVDTSSHKAGVVFAQRSAAHASFSHLASAIAAPHGVPKPLAKAKRQALTLPQREWSKT